MTNICQDNGYKVLNIHYADILKFVCEKYYGWNGVKDETGRELLQFLGTDVVRNNNENCWVNCVIGLVKGLQTEYDYVLIPDCRFPNEIESWNDTDFNIVSVRIVRYNEDGSLYENHLQKQF